MEQVRGLTPYQCQSPQYNAVKIDIHQPKVEAPKNNHCKGEHPYSLYGQKGKNSASMPLPSHVAKKEHRQVKDAIVEDKKPEIQEAIVEAQNENVTFDEPVVIDEPIEQTQEEI